MDGGAFVVCNSPGKSSASAHRSARGSKLENLPWLNVGALGEVIRKPPLAKHRNGCDGPDILLLPNALTLYSSLYGAEVCLDGLWARVT